MRAPVFVALVAVATVFLIAPARVIAQERLDLKLDLTFYGDNTEFFNPWREGETLLGTESRIFLDLVFNEHVTLRGGIFGNHRFGDTNNFHIVRPVAAIHFQNNYPKFVIGSIESGTQEVGAGPDQLGPHGLLPPLQRESLAFSRPDEAGLQWTFDLDRFEHETWINWQHLNTEESREIFDAGLHGQLGFNVGQIPALVSYQFHIVHQGGQLFASGPVGDSYGGGPGLIFELPAWRFDKQTAEVHGLVSRDIPDRVFASDADNGFGLFVRWAAEKSGWRGHLIGWRARDFAKMEGDKNYASRREDGGLTSLRHYAEAGLTRTYSPADGVGLELSARLHRVDTHTNYSYRILAKVDLGFPLDILPKP